MEQNYNTEQPDGGVPIKMWTRGVPVEDEAQEAAAPTPRACPSSSSTSR